MRWKLFFLRLSSSLRTSSLSLSLILVGRGRSPAAVSNWVHVLLLSCAGAITPTVMQHCRRPPVWGRSLSPHSSSLTAQDQCEYNLEGGCFSCVSGHMPTCAQFSTRAASTRSSLVGHCPYLCSHLFKSSVHHLQLLQGRLLTINLALCFHLQTLTVPLWALGSTAMCLPWHVLLVQVCVPSVTCPVLLT